MNTYTITHDIIGDGEITLEQLSQMVVEWNNDYPGWTFTAETSGDDLRVYCQRDGAEAPKPSFSVMWEMVTDDYGYITVAEIAMGEDDGLAADPTLAVMTVMEIAEDYAITEDGVRAAIRRGMPARQSGGTWLIDRQQVAKRWKKRVTLNLFEALHQATANAIQASRDLSWHDELEEGSPGAAFRNAYEDAAKSERQASAEVAEVAPAVRAAVEAVAQVLGESLAPEFLATIETVAPTASIAEAIEAVADATVGRLRYTQEAIKFALLLSEQAQQYAPAEPAPPAPVAEANEVWASDFEPRTHPNAPVRSWEERIAAGNSEITLQEEALARAGGWAGVDATIASKDVAAIAAMLQDSRLRDMIMFRISKRETLRGVFENAEIPQRPMPAHFGQQANGFSVQPVILNKDEANNAARRRWWNTLNRGECPSFEFDRSMIAEFPAVMAEWLILG